jgi:hypothetical protein
MNSEIQHLFNSTQLVEQDLRSIGLSEELLGSSVESVYKTFRERREIVDNVV